MMAMAAKPRDEMIRTRKDRSWVGTAPGGVLPSGVAAMAVVVVVEGSVMKSRRWVEQEELPW